MIIINSFIYKLGKPNFMIGRISREDYLGVIYSLSEGEPEKGDVSSVDIAKKLGVSKASVSEMMKKLSSNKYVLYGKYSKIRLTEKGMKKAKKIIHNHRIIEFFLKEVLKCDLRKIHEEAHKLEHAFSDYTIKKLDNFLGNPKIGLNEEEIH